MRACAGWVRHFVWVLALIIWSGMASATPVVTGLSYGKHQDRVRVILTVSESPTFAAFTLSDPDRLVIDLPELEWEVPEDQASEPIPYIGDIRHGLFRRDRARIVMDLMRPVEVERIFTQPRQGTEPARLVLDLSPVSRSEYDSRAGWPEKARWQDTLILPNRRPGRSGIVVAIDPGHGGIDPGAVAGKLVEKAIVLDFSRRLAEILRARGRFEPFLTRDTDIFVPLAERIARAHAAGANLLLSIHADFVQQGVANGISVYTLSDKGSDDAADALAARENRADVIAGADLGGETDDLTRLLVELAQRGTRVESSRLAESLLESLGKELELLRTRPHRQANFRVLKAPDIPSILLELGFLNSKRDQKRLADPVWLETAARSLADGIEIWAKTTNPGFLRPK
ncbi:MAG: N-acetylmuramoyl-L-alanine amidase [Pseudomonadota bacterium]